MDNLASKIEQLVERNKKVKEKRAALQGRLQAKKEELARLIEEIKKAGFNPNTLAEDLKQAEAQLEEEVMKFEASLKEVEEALASFEDNE